MKKISNLLLLMITMASCAVKDRSPFADLYSMFTGLWALFLLLGIASGIYSIFGDDDKKRSNSGTAAMICLILFVALLITA